VRCAFCGVEHGPDIRLAAGPGVAICGGCAAAAVVVTGPPPDGWSPPSRRGWVGGAVDRETLAALPTDELVAELATVWAVAEPLRAFADAGAEVLGVDLSAPACAGHREPVTLVDGTVVWAVSWHGAAPYERDDTPDFGLYLDDRWSPPWPHAHIDWPDFGVPADREAATAALADLLARARAGRRVEVGCLGGHGRTGTALALLAVLADAPPAGAVAWVRSAYCAKAVETAEQAAYVEATSAR
jgi:ClpX C4-type zinc finger